MDPGARPAKRLRSAVPTLPVRPTRPVVLFGSRSQDPTHRFPAEKVSMFEVWILFGERPRRTKGYIVSVSFRRWDSDRFRIRFVHDFISCKRCVALGVEELCSNTIRKEREDEMTNVAFDRLVPGSLRKKNEGTRDVDDPEEPSFSIPAVQDVRPNEGSTRCALSIGSATRPIYGTNVRLTFRWLRLRTDTTRSRWMRSREKPSNS